jgi:hypothetical protein
MDKRSHPILSIESNLQPVSGSMSAVADMPVFQSLPLRTVFPGCVRRGGIAQSLLLTGGSKCATNSHRFTAVPGR